MMEERETNFSEAHSTSTYQTFINEDESSEESYTVEEAVENIGFGKFQVFISLAAGLAWVADSMEVMVLSILGPVLTCSWRINTTQEAGLTTAVFVGYLIGSPIFGYLADTFGRKKSLIMNTSWACAFGVVSAMAPKFGWLLILRAMVGFGIGGGPQAVTYGSEFLPNKYRGKAIILIEVFFAVGAMLEVVLAIVVLVPLGWRWWLGASAIPCALFVMLCLWLPESPRFDLANNNPEKATKTLELAANMNGAKMPPGKLIPEPQPKRGNIKDLFVQNLWKTSLANMYLWFACGFIYYGAILFTTEFIKMESPCESGDINGTGVINGTRSENLSVFLNNSAEKPCHQLQLSDYYLLVWTSAAELPGLILTVFLIDVLGRKWTIAFDFIISSVMWFLMCLCMDRVAMMIVLFTGRALISSAFQVMYAYTTEVYPTPVRALSVGLGSMMGRLGAIITPYIAEVLLESSILYAMWVYGVVGLIGAVVAALLSIETSGKSLK